MNTKLVFAGLAAAAMLLPAVGAKEFTEQPFDYLTLLPPDFSCENGSHATSFPDPLNPGLTVHIHIQCPGEVAHDVATLTDCTGTSWSHWVGPQANAWSYTFDTANPYGFSQSAVASAWDGANGVWEAATVPARNIYNGYTLATVSATSGTFDSYILAEFRYLSGQLRTAVGVQWAWEGTGANAGKIVHTDAAYNTRYAFSLTGAPNTYDLQSVAAHEMGHGYGLGHANTASSSACLTLYPYATLGATHGRTLGDGDLISIDNRY